jgi:hypothetical protein
MACCALLRWWPLGHFYCVLLYFLIEHQEEISISNEVRVMSTNLVYMNRFVVNESAGKGN